MADYATIERSILAMMLDAEQAPNIVSEVEPADFQHKEYRELYQGMRALYEQGKSIDLMVLATELKQNIREVMDIAGFATFARGNLSAQIQALKDQRERNELTSLCESVSKRAGTGNMDELKAEILQAITPKMKEKELIEPKDAARFALETYAERKDKKSNGGIWTSYKELNYCMNGGFEPGQLIILAAKTKKGKSAFTSNILRDIGITQRIPSLLITTEMNQEQLSLRNAAILSGVDHYKIATGQTDEAEDQRVLDGLEKLYKSQLYTLYAPDLNVNKMTAYLRQFVIQHKIRIAAVDYIGRVDTQDPRLQEYQVLRNAAKRLKTLAQQLEITIIMVAQITDEGNLEGAKAMRNECDMLAHLRPMNDEEVRECSGFNYCLAIESNRSGPQAKIPLNYYGNILTFTDKQDLAQNFADRTEQETASQTPYKKKNYHKSY